MFNRPEQSYIVTDTVIDGILQDQANSLCQIAKQLPEGVTVLDIGAGSGILGRLLRRIGKHVVIDAIEPNEFAVDHARPFYRTIYQGYAQAHFQAIQAIKYDYIILADVIEHIPDPSNFLAELLAHIPESTKLIISIPNIAFGGVRLALMNGYFDYVDSGLLERTHLRFFTFASVQRLFKNLNLYSERILSLDRSFYRVEFDRRQLSAPLFTAWTLAHDREALAYQYLFFLTKKQCSAKPPEHIGTSAMRIMIDAIVFRPSVRKIVRNVRRWREH